MIALFTIKIIVENFALALIQAEADGIRIARIIIIDKLLECCIGGCLLGDFILGDLSYLTHDPDGITRPHAVFGMRRHRRFMVAADGDLSGGQDLTGIGLMPKGKKVDTLFISSQNAGNAGINRAFVNGGIGQAAALLQIAENFLILHNKHSFADRISG